MIEYNESMNAFVQKTREYVNSLIDDMPVETPEAFFDTVEQIAFLGAEAELSADEMESFADKLSEVGRAAGLLKDNQRITINAEGDLSVITEAENAADELNGKEVELTVNADASEAYAIIDGVQYKVAEYNSATGEAVLTVDGEKAEMMINLQTGEVRRFDEEEGKATLSAVDNVTETAENAAAALEKLQDKKITVTAVITGAYQKIKEFVSGNAEGTSDFKGGLAMINDEKGKADPRELVEVNGKGYIFEGRDVVLPLPRHAKVYTADQTKDILGNNIPHYASGKDTTAFERAKSAFVHKTKVSEVAVADELAWWKAVSETISLTAEEAEEVEEEIYALTKKLNEESVSDYKKRINNQISDGERWLSRQKELYNISYDEQIDIWKRLDGRHFDTLREMVENVEMTEEEKAEIWEEYYKEHEDRIIKIAELEKQKNKEVFESLKEDSESYISDRNFYNDWSDYGDDPLEAWERLQERYNSEIANETDADRKKELAAELKEMGEDMFSQRKEDSERWMETEEYYGNLSAENYFAALERRRVWLKQYYDAGIITHRKYIEESEELDKLYYSKAKELFEESIEEYYSAERKRLEAMRDAIEEEYEEAEERDTTAERNEKLEELREQEAVFAGAVTKEGAEKLKDIREQIEELEKEEANSLREKEKEKRLEKLDEEIDALEEEQQKALNGTAKAAAEMARGVEQSVENTASALESFVKSYSERQDEIIKLGITTLSSVIGQVSEQLKDIAAYGAEMNNYYNNNSYTDNSSTVTVNQNISERWQGDAFASSLSRRLAVHGKVG